MTADLWHIPYEVREEILDSIITEVTYTPMPSGKALVCEITLQNGFTVHGISATVDKSKFNIDTSKSISYAKARKKIWELEAYLVQEQQYKESN